MVVVVIVALGTRELLLPLLTDAQMVYRSSTKGEHHVRIGYFVVLLGFLGGISAARADVITWTSSNLSGMPPCYSSGPTASTCSSSGTGTNAGAFATASGGEFGGNVEALAYGHASMGGAPAVASAQLQINGEYVLYGGTGSGFLDLNYHAFANQGPSNECSVVISGGNAQSCDDPVIVQYGIPFIMDVELSVFAEAGELGEGSQGQLSMDFAQQPGLELVNSSPAPEPTSILLLMPGLGGVFLAAKSRAKVR